LIAVLSLSFLLEATSEVYSGKNQEMVQQFADSGRTSIGQWISVLEILKERNSNDLALFIDQIIDFLEKEEKRIQMIKLPDEGETVSFME